MGKTIDEMTLEEKMDLGRKAYDLLVQIWAKQNNCIVVRKEKEQ